MNTFKFKSITQCEYKNVNNILNCNLKYSVTDRLNRIHLYYNMTISLYRLHNIYACFV